MNILMISPQYKPIIGGYERAAERLSATLAARGHEVTVATERRDQRWPRRERQDGVEVRRWFCLYRPKVHIVSSLAALFWFLLRKGRGFEVWHVHQYGPHAALSVAMAKLLRRPVVVKLTNSGKQGINSTLSQGRFPRLMTYLHRKVSAIVALTRETAAEAVAFGIAPERIMVLGNGVDTEDYRPRSEAERQVLRHSLGITAPHCLVMVGRLSPEKNVAGLIRAWALAVPQLGAGWQLVIVGDGALRDALSAYCAELLVAGSVRLVGQQPNIADWMGAAEGYVLTSDNEGMSNAMLEAMSTGLPILCTQVFGTAELVSGPGCGLVVPVGDMVAFAAAMVTCAANPKARQAMGDNARKVIEDQFSIERIAASYERLYCSLTDPTATAPKVVQ